MVLKWSFAFSIKSISDIIRRMIIDIVKVFLPSLVAFCLGVIITPSITNFLYERKMWKKKGGKKALDGTEAKVFNELHEVKEVGTPRMGGSVIWIAAGGTALLIWILSKVSSIDVLDRLDFISRNQTWIPLFTLLAGACIGLVDDFLEIKEAGGGLSLKKRLILVGGIGLACGLWFFYKLDIIGIGLPGGGTFILGALFPIFFALVTIAIYSGGVIDGIDGLAGGIFASMFTAYAGIAFYQQQFNLAALCATITGGILAFLWFNIPPARFYMSETGSMALTITLSVVAFMTDSLGGGYGILVLPVIAMPLIATTLSNLIQVTSKKLRGKKVFLVAPLHHHFEALGWPSYKVTMRFWIVGVVFAMLGVVLALIG